jgi:hypothetical protein
MIRYLLDEVDNKETDYRDAMRPAAVDPERGLQGEAQLQSHPTFDDMHSAINVAVETTHTLFESTVNRKFEEIRSLLGPHSHGHTQPTTHHPPPSTASAHPRLVAVEKPARFVAYKPPPNVEPTPYGGVTDSIPTNIAIPKVSVDVPTDQRWKEWVHQWEHATPELGNHIPLKDWKPEWYSGSVGGPKFGMLYRARQLVAQEFIEV